MLAVFSLDDALFVSHTVGLILG